MLSGLNGSVWTEDKEAQKSTANNNNISNSCDVMESKEEMGSLSTFKSMLEVEEDWGGGVLGNYTDLSPNNLLSTSNLCSDPLFSTTRTLQLPESGSGFTGFRAFVENSGNTLFLNRSKLLRPLETFPSMGAQPTLFQKRAALRKNLTDNGSNLGVLSGIEIDKGKREMTQLGEENEKKRKLGNLDDTVEDVSIDGSGLNYDSDELTENIKMERLMDRASILGDAIEYLKELLQRINDLHNELESTPPGSSLTPTSFHPLTPTPSTCRAVSRISFVQLIAKSK
ncbi:hypothetical protein GH714_040504 [Hevea brasiliensis]|uniref:BHLH domain-containing protein n=1 Tax=Hevea brasiliensis TaxID=3981 RepID=A0A6A6MHP6_HEVBR|nr:hypothetical protein GH714_040504 [Hevea brasiliensis]